MSAPSGKPSPEGTRSSDAKQAMAIQDADTGANASVVPIMWSPCLPPNAPEVISTKLHPKHLKSLSCHSMILPGFRTVGTIITHPGRACLRVQITCNQVMPKSISRNLICAEHKSDTAQPIACEYT